MFNKCLILTVFVIALSLSANPIKGATQWRAPVNVTYVGNNLYIGKRQSGDWALAQYPAYKAAIPYRVVNQTLTINSIYTLTFLSVIDQSFNKTLGAIPRLVRGGPGYKYAIINFTSKVGQPINHRVNPFGRK